MSKTPTPGPWRARQTNSRTPWEIRTPAAPFEGWPLGRFVAGDMTEGDARLAAGAPAMLAALKAAERFVGGFEDDELQEGINELLQDMRAAIAAAAPASQEA